MVNNTVTFLLHEIRKIINDMEEGREQEWDSNRLQVLVGDLFYALNHPHKDDRVFKRVDTKKVDAKLQVPKPSCLDSAFEREAIDRGLVNAPVFTENKIYLMYKKDKENESNYKCSNRPGI